MLFDGTGPLGVEIESPWIAAVATGLAYAIVLGVVFTVLFLVPYLLFSLL